MDFFSKKKTLRVRVAGVITNERKELLLLQQSKKGAAKGNWLLPGGGLEYGGYATDALARELKEELGLEAKDFHLLFVSESIDPKGQRHILQLVFKVQVQKANPVLNPKEKAITGFGFFSKEEIKSMDLRPDTRAILGKAKLPSSEYFITEWIE